MILRESKGKVFLVEKLIAAEYHIGTEITTDKQTACVVTLHICAFMFFHLDVCNDKIQMFQFWE